MRSSISMRTYAANLANVPCQRRLEIQPRWRRKIQPLRLATEAALGIPGAAFVCGVVVSGLLPGPALSETVGLAIHLEDVDVMGQAIEQRAGQTLIAEDAGPLVERQVGDDDGGAALIALADQFEEERGAGLGEWHEDELVDDEKFSGLQASSAA